MLRFFEENDISIQLSDISLLAKIFSKKNQTIELFEHATLGKILVIDNEIQHIEAWAPFYHESLIHIPALFLPDIKNVLILGGGSFYAAAEVLKYSSVNKVIMVDHDKEVIGLMKKHYKHVQPILNNPKFQLLFSDIKTFLTSNTDYYDLIVNDALDLLSAGKKMFQILSSFLTTQGVCSDVIYRHIFERQRTKETIIRLKKEYASAFSLLAIPEYPGFFHLLSMWSQNKNISQYEKITRNKIQQQWNDNNNPCLFYNPKFVEYYLYLPPYLKKWVNIL